MHLLFVCTGNTCRSPMAVGIAKRAIEQRGLDWTVESAGTFAAEGSPMAKNAEKALVGLGIRPEYHSSKPLTASQVQAADMIFTMTSSQAWELRANYPFAFDKIHELGVYATAKGAPLSESCDIVDPVGGSLTIYVQCANTLVQFIEATIDKLVQSDAKDGVEGANDGGEKQ